MTVEWNSRAGSIPTNIDFGGKKSERDELVFKKKICYKKYCKRLDIDVYESFRWEVRKSEKTVVVRRREASKTTRSE